MLENLHGRINILDLVIKSENGMEKAKLTEYLGNSDRNIIESNLICTVTTENSAQPDCFKKRDLMK
jgi:hypothetical protein